MLEELTIDLSRPPRDRWSLQPAHVAAGRSLLRLYNDDLGIDAATASVIASAAREVVPAELLEEMEGLGQELGVEPESVLMANLHYDLLKEVLGCTAFAVETPEGPLHARNLDWWTSDRVLNDGTVVTQFCNGPCGDFFSVGWPAFAGVFSGMAPGRFSVTLNAVLSGAPGEIALPVVFLLREVLETAPDFDVAVARLAEAEIASDCLLLVTGTESGQRVVVERTPTEYALRGPDEEDRLVVANDYVLIDVQSGEPTHEIAATSCGRFERAGALLSSRSPGDLGSCLETLSDERVRMGITVQQMAFHPRSGGYVVETP